MTKTSPLKVSGSEREDLKMTTVELSAPGHTQICACGRDERCHWPWKVEFQLPGDATSHYFKHREVRAAEEFATEMESMGATTQTHYSASPGTPYVPTATDKCST